MSKYYLVTQAAEFRSASEERPRLIIRLNERRMLSELSKVVDGKATIMEQG